MTRTISITDGSAPANGETIIARSYRLLAADGSTELSTAAPPYTGVTDALVYVEQTVTQSDDQAGVATVAVPGRVTDLAASTATRPVLTWSEVGGETSYEVHRGAAGFAPDVLGGTTRLVALAAGVGTHTDGSIAGDGVTSYAYRVVAKTSFGYTIGNEAVTIPAAPVVEYATDFSTAGTLTGYAPPWVQGPGYNLNNFVAAGGSAYIRGDGIDGAMYDPVVPSTADQSTTVTLTPKTLLDQEVGLIFRASGAGNSSALLCYEAAVTRNGDQYDLVLRYRNGAGGATNFASASLAALPLDASYEFYATVFDANGGVVLNAHVGNVALTFTDTSGAKITTIGRRGLYGVASGGTSDTTGLQLLDYEAT